MDLHTAYRTREPTSLEHAAFQEGMAIGQEIAYTKGDLFRGDFDLPLNPYVMDKALHYRFQRGLETALGDHFRSDLELWLKIETDFVFTRGLWTTADIRREGRKLMNVRFLETALESS